MFLTFTIRNLSWAQNQHISMLSEGSCNTKDWSNGSLAITGKNYIKILKL